MFCKQCGKELKDGAVFCSNCGYKIVNNTSENIDVPSPEISTVCSECGASLKEGAAFCNACGASTVPATDAPAQTEVPYEAPKEGQERVYSFKASGDGDTSFHLTHDTLVVNKSETSDTSQITCIPYCVITRIQYTTRKIIPAIVITAVIAFIFFLLMMNVNPNFASSSSGAEEWETKLGPIFIHGVRIFSALAVVFCLLNCRQTVLTVFAGKDLAYEFYVSAVKNEKEKEWERFYEELRQLMHMKPSEEEIKNNHTILTGTIKADAKASGMALIARLQNNAKKNGEN